ncbi:MAG: cytochrome C assembly family protein, partial [Janthinobacterium lividum]
LPALLTMEKLLFRLIGLGFFLLTLTVVSGVVFSEELFGQPFRFSHKTVFTMLSWLLFGLLLAGRRWRGWRGKTALRFTLSGFATLFLAYVGSRFVLEVILHRGLA